MKKFSFQKIIKELESYWSKKGCSILQPYDVEMGAGTFHPATVFQSLNKENWYVAYVQPSRRPHDSRYALHPNRYQHYYQFQVILKPYPSDAQQMYLDSIENLGISCKKHDIRFVEDDWESPTLGSSGLGWEVWCDGMEISQFTYMQQIGGIKCDPIIVEITYGLERLALHIQGIDEVRLIDWNGFNGKYNLRYGDIHSTSEKQFSLYNLELCNTDMLIKHFQDYELLIITLIENSLPLPAYDYCIKMNHILNLLISKRVISVTERAHYINKIRNLTRDCCLKYRSLID